MGSWLAIFNSIKAFVRFGKKVKLDEAISLDYDQNLALHQRIAEQLDVGFYFANKCIA